MFADLRKTAIAANEKITCIDINDLLRNMTYLNISCYQFQLLISRDVISVLLVLIL